MITYKCLVNGTIAEQTRRRVVDGLARINAEHFGIPAAELSVEFTEVARGLWFTAGEPSRASMVLGSVPPGTPRRRAWN